MALQFWAIESRFGKDGCAPAQPQTLLVQAVANIATYMQPKER